MTPRTWIYGEREGEGEREDDREDLPVRDRPYESFGQQGLAMPTYGTSRPIHRHGASSVDLGERVPSGPKGWQRRDDRIHDDVCAHLTDDGYVDASDLEVVVHHGEVILTGTVQDRAQRNRAIRIADAVRGVVDVVDRIHVVRPAQSESDEPGRR